MVDDGIVCFRQLGFRWWRLAYGGERLFSAPIRAEIGC